MLIMLFINVIRILFHDQDKNAHLKNYYLFIKTGENLKLTYIKK